MINFLKKIILFAIPILLAILVCVVVFGSTIPNVSNSISFNAKMLFLKKKKFDSSINVLAVGSSMTLNNISSNSINTSLDTSYLNTASWGQSIADDFKLIKIFNPIYKPKTIVMVSNFMDFQNEWSKIKFKLIEPYISNTYTYKGFDLKYNINNAEKLESYQKDSTLYNYLNYDAFGGINLDSQNLKIDAARWKGRAIGEISLDPNQYSYLDSISNYCKVNKIGLIFVQSPFRAGYSANLNNNQKQFLRTHIQKVESVLIADGHQFIDTSSKLPWPDELFADYSHLNSEGAQLFTDLFLDEVKKASFSD